MSKRTRKRYAPEFKREAVSLVTQHGYSKAVAGRRLFSSLERPIGTSSGYNTVWHGYAPYNPRMLEKYLTIFRSMNNFVFVGDDGKTPAMRLGFAKQPLTYDDILWPGQRIPQRKRRRRKGKVIPGLRRAA